MCWHGLPGAFPLHGGVTMSWHAKEPLHGARVVDEFRPPSHGNRRLRQRSRVPPDAVDAHAKLHERGRASAAADDDADGADAGGVRTTASWHIALLPAAALHATATDVVPPGLLPSASRASTTMPKHVAAPEPAHDTATAWAALTCMPRHAPLSPWPVHATDVETVPLPLRTAMSSHASSPGPAHVTATDDGAGDDAADRVVPTRRSRHRECGLPRYQRYPLFPIERRVA